MLDFGGDWCSNPFMVSHIFHLLVFLLNYIFQLFYWFIFNVSILLEVSFPYVSFFISSLFYECIVSPVSLRTLDSCLKLCSVSCNISDHCMFLKYCINLFLFWKNLFLTISEALYIYVIGRWIWKIEMETCSNEKNHAWHLGIRTVNVWVHLFAETHTHMHTYVGVLTNTWHVFNWYGVIATYGFLIPCFLFVLLFLLHISGFPETPGRPLLTFKLRKRPGCAERGLCVCCQAALEGEWVGDPRAYVMNLALWLMWK